MLRLINISQVLEFADDLKYYWNDGYGYKLSYEQACPALRDVFNFFAYVLKFIYIKHYIIKI